MINKDSKWLNIHTCIDTTFTHLNCKKLDFVDVWVGRARCIFLLAIWHRKSRSTFLYSVVCPWNEAYIDLFNPQYTINFKFCNHVRLLQIMLTNTVTSYLMTRFVFSITKKIFQTRYFMTDLLHFIKHVQYTSTDKNSTDFQMSWCGFAVSMLCCHIETSVEEGKFQYWQPNSIIIIANMLFYISPLR